MYNIETAEKILNYIRQQKVGTSEIADCLNKTGAIPGCHPVNRGIYKAGIVHYVYAHSDSNWSLHEQLSEFPENRIIFADAINVNNKALFGDLVTMYLIEKKNAVAVVTPGLMRDAAELIKGSRPVWCSGFTPEGCFNIPREESPEILQTVQKNRDYYENSIAVCDDCGVVIIPKEEITDAFYEKIITLEEQEKMWFHCVRELGWNTFDTVCLKKYNGSDSIDAPKNRGDA